MSTFEPTRLSVAMRRRGMTQRELADKCGKTSQYISMLERGEDTPSDEMVNKIAIALRFPRPFFYGDTVDLFPAESLSFRAKRSMTSQTRDTGLGSSYIAANIITVDLEKRFNLPRIDIPDLTGHSPETAASEVRSFWGLGYEPIHNMVHLLESKGVGVFWISHDSPSLDGISFWRENKPFTLLNTLKVAGERGRFDAAHELGHLVLHRHEETLDKREKEKDKEDEANLFASAFLMPKERFVQECPERPDLEHLYQIKPRWKVSVQAMIMRGADLGIFSEWQKRQAFTHLNAIGMREREKLLLPREHSRLHDMIFDAMFKKGVPSTAYAQMLHIYFEELAELMPLAANYIPNQDRTSKESQEIRRGHLRVIMGGKQK